MNLSLKKKGYLLVNFGGPRHLSEITPFLKALLTDQEVIRTPFPSWLHKILFHRVVKKRVPKLIHDYELIGGKSPIFEDTEFVASALRPNLDGPLVTFHRYLPKTHNNSFRALQEMDVDVIRVFPFFPQFSYATTGSSALFLSKCLPGSITSKFQWVKSYPNHPSYIDLIVQMIREFLQQRYLQEEEVFFLFSAHGLPQTFIQTGDPYEKEVESTFWNVKKQFPKSEALLCYQSKFGKGEWLSPYTEVVCQEIQKWNSRKLNVIFVPISFTSDHIETLFEVEKLYMPLIEQAGLKSYRLPAFNRRLDWIKTIYQILMEYTPFSNNALVR